MNETQEIIRLQIENTLLSLQSELRSLYSALDELQLYSQTLFALTAEEPQVYEAWLKAEGFARDDEGYFTRQPLLAAYRGGEAKPDSAAYYCQKEHLPDVRQRLYSLRESGRILQRTRSRLGSKAQFVYYQDRSGSVLIYPFFDARGHIPPNYRWQNSCTFQSVCPSRNPEGGIRWSLPHCDRCGQGLFMTVSIPVSVGSSFVGVWSIDVRLAELFNKCLPASPLPHQQHYVVDAEGRLISHATHRQHEAAESEILWEPVSILGGDFARLNVRELMERRHGRLSLEDGTGRKLVLFYHAVADVDWLLFICSPYSLMADVAAKEISEAFAHIRAGDFSYRIPSHAPEVHALVKESNELAEALEESIAQRERVERELRENEQLLRQIINLVPHQIFAKDKAGRLLLANQATAEALGMTIEELEGRIHGEVHPNPAEAAGFLRQDQLVIENQAPLFVEREEFTTAKGERRIQQTSKMPFRLPNGEIGVLGVAVDVTDRVRAEQQRAQLEAQVSQSQKLESLGLLAGGIAHDFNNLLVGILGSLDLAIEEVAPGTPLGATLKGAATSARRAADLARQMLAYAGRGSLRVEPVDLNAIVEEMKSLLEASISKKVALGCALAQRLPLVRADATQLRQVLLNLVINAAEAIEVSGTVTVTTCARQYSREFFRDAYVGAGAAAGQYVCLEVSDTGAGMSPEVISKIFDPFFTTKVNGRGLGLASVLGIVRGHGGAIKVSSEPGSGSSFHIFLPAVPGIEAASVAAKAAESGWKGAGVALVADDEPIVREVAKKMLERSGFSVITADNGRDAVAEFLAHRSEIRFVLLDLTMPEIDGEDVFRELRKISADLPIIVMSGFPEQEMSRRLANAEQAAFIQKPFTLQDLRAGIQKFSALRASERVS